MLNGVPVVVKRVDASERPAFGARWAGEALESPGEASVAVGGVAGLGEMGGCSRLQLDAALKNFRILCPV